MFDIFGKFRHAGIFYVGAAQCNVYKRKYSRINKGYKINFIYTFTTLHLLELSKRYNPDTTPSPQPFIFDGTVTVVSKPRDCVSQ